MPEVIENIEYNVENIRRDFPILNTVINGKPLVYLDNAASTQKPIQVINALVEYYSGYNSNVHRGVHHLSQRATEAYEDSRRAVANFINAESSDEIIFTKGCTESINLVAYSLSSGFLKTGDEVIITEMEHHANIVPWQEVRDRIGIKLKYIPMNEKGELIIEELDKLLSEKTKLVAVTHISNTLGTINPIKEIIAKAHDAGAKVLIDAAQSVQHLRIDVRDLDCDFLTFSGHKIYAPTGIGVLYGKRELLESMPPYQTGGDMIKSVTMEKTIFNDIPNRFEAGTPNIAGAIGLNVALDYLSAIGLDKIENYERKLTEYATSKLNEIDGLRIIGNSLEKSSGISFIVAGVHHYDIGTIIDQMGVAIRTGQHCTEPIMHKFGITGTARASFGIYTTKEEIDYLVFALHKAIKMLK